MEISLAGWSLHRRFEHHDAPLALLDYPKLARDEFDITKVELNSPFFEYEVPDSQATSPIRKRYLGELRRRADDAGVELVSVAVDDHGDLAATDESARNAAVENHRKWFDVCRELGCSGFRANSGGERGDITEAQIEQCTKSFTRLGEYAAEAGIKLMMENHWGISADAERMVRILDAVDSEAVGALADFRNWPPDADPYASLARIAPHAIFVHAKYLNFDERGEDPDFDTARVMKIFRDVGYRGTFGIEFEGQGDDHEGVVKSKALLARHAY